jgi:hypothetical protein
METFLIVLAVIALSWRPAQRPLLAETTMPMIETESVGQIRSLPDKLLLT